MIAASAADAEQQRALSPQVVAALTEAGTFRSLVPGSLGGGELHPAVLCAAIEQIAAADGAAGWCAAIGATSGLAAAYLQPEPAQQLFGKPSAVGAGAFAPRGRLAPADGGGFLLSGRWPLASGISHATSVGLGCLHPERGPLYAVVERGAVEVVDTWDSLGLRATASHDIVAEQLELPEERLVALVGGAPVATGALYAFPLFGLLALSVAAVCTGIARGALDEVVALAGKRKPAGGSRSLAERGTAQERVASAEAALRAARAGVSVAIDTAWETAVAGAPLGTDERLGLRLAATHAARSAVEVVDTSHTLAGAAGLYRGTLERRLRDVHTAAQHMIVAPATLELSGRLLLGLETETAQL